jgi:ribosomal protein S18 acetylase RimI-like enzyme
MEIEYKKADEADIPTLISIEQSIASTKSYSPMLDADEWKEALEKGKVFLLKKGGEVIGNASYEDHGGGIFYISGLVISPEFQGQGYGRAVLKKLLEDMSDAKRIELVTHPENSPALKLYKEAGFHIESRKENYYGDGEPRLILAISRFS